MNQRISKTEVCIVGAGPAGTIAALFLAKKGIPCILADKASFPRDKICGDGISGWVVSVLAELDEDLLLKLNKQPFLLHSHGLRLSAPSGKMLDLPFLDSNHISTDIPPGYICKRIDFDHFMLEEAKARPEIDVMENTEVTGYSIQPDGIKLETSTGDLIHASMAIFANGANSGFMKDPGGIYKTKRHTMTGLKAYFKGVTGAHEKNYVELHFLEKVLPGYFWIFPLPSGEANVGIGLDQETITRKKISLKKLMFDAIEKEPHIKHRFSGAAQISPVQAYNLPLWDKPRKISGERYLLAGDTASLVDPVTGEGIGHAALCGMFSAIQAERAIKSNDFSPGSMAQYDRDVYNKIGKELRISSKVPRFIRHAWLFNAVVARAVNSKELQEKLMLAMTDLEARKELKTPWLYMKVLMGF